MRICLINASPRAKGSTSEMLSGYLLPMLEGHQVTRLHVAGVTEELPEQLRGCDALVLLFPLYADSFPSHVVRLLEQLYAADPGANVRFYAVINNGFYEGKQCEVAVRQLRLFARAAGLVWGQAICVGAGELHRSLQGIPLGKGPNKNLGRALARLAKNILQCTDDADVYTQPNCPRTIWRWLARTFMWNAKAKENGLSKKDLYRRIGDSNDD